MKARKMESGLGAVTQSQNGAASFKQQGRTHSYLWVHFIYFHKHCN